MRLAATVHIDVMFAVAALRLRELGAEVFLAAASSHTTRDDVRLVRHLNDRLVARGTSGSGCLVCVHGGDHLC